MFNYEVVEWTEQMLHATGVMPCVMRSLVVVALPASSASLELLPNGSRPRSPLIAYCPNFFSQANVPEQLQSNLIREQVEGTVFDQVSPPTLKFALHVQTNCDLTEQLYSPAEFAEQDNGGLPAGHNPDFFLSG